ncbi:hypothetical protein BT69DRAFT_1318259 [Atractiella rhizophila]|nr:hypothetical protein BT69DRAFT_1318259 [Atractiella rhizophila]
MQNDAMQADIQRPSPESLTPPRYQSPDERTSPSGLASVSKHRVLVNLHEKYQTFDTNTFSTRFLTEEEEEKVALQELMQEFAELCAEFCTWFSVRIEQLGEETSQSLEAKVTEVQKLERDQEQKRLRMLKAVEGITKCLRLLQEPSIVERA